MSARTACPQGKTAARSEIENSLEELNFAHKTRLGALVGKSSKEDEFLGASHLEAITTEGLACSELNFKSRVARDFHLERLAGVDSETERLYSQKQEEVAEVERKCAAEEDE